MLSTRMRFADLEAVTVDGYGTLLRLTDPVPELALALRELGVERSPSQVSAAFQAEVAYYRPRSAQGRDAESLARLRRDCVSVFLSALGTEIAAASFAPAFVKALRFELVPGAQEALEQLRGHGLALAVVANWDISLREHLAALAVDGLFSAVVTSAEVGAEKPDPVIFRYALAQLGVVTERALHVGDEPVDERGARAAGMRFAAAPLRTAFEGWA